MSVWFCPTIGWESVTDKEMNRRTDEPWRVLGYQSFPTVGAHSAWADNDGEAKNKRDAMSKVMKMEK